MVIGVNIKNRALDRPILINEQKWNDNFHQILY